jgi:hypothetical protein
MPNRKQKVEGTLYRELELRQGAVIDEDKRTVRVSASSELPVVRSSFFRDPWVEVLGHDKDEVDLARLQNGASVHYNHSRQRSDRIGVVESASIVNKRLQATVRISQREDVDDVWQDIRDGILKNISIGYTIGERALTRENKDGPDEYRVTRWTPHEVSFVDIPADPSVGVGRNESGELMYRVHDIGDSTMPDKVTNIDAARKEGVALERARVSTINSVFAPYPQLDEVRTLCIDEGKDENEARKLLLEEMGRDSFSAGGDAYRPGEFRDTHFSMPDRRDDFQKAAVDAVCNRAGVRIAKPHAAAQDLVGCSLLDMIRLQLGRQGINTARMTPNELIKRAHTTSDFPLLLQDAADKSVLVGYNEAPGTHRGWTTQQFARDFKPKNFAAAGESPDLALVNEDGEFTYGTLVEDGTNVTLATYGKLLAFSRQAVINDDTGELLRAARSFGASATRLESDITYGVLVANPVMSDGLTLFHANHNNIGTGAAPSVTSLGEARELLRKQTGLAGNAFLDLQPFAVIAPPELETVFEQLLSSLFDPFPATTGDTAARNPFANRLELIIDPRLSADSATRWYVCTNPDVFQWAVRVHLEGQPNPYVEEQAGWAIDGLEIKVRHDFAALISEFRGIVKNDGV